MPQVPSKSPHASPFKSRKRPEETRKSPARKLRRLAKEVETDVVDSDLSTSKATDTTTGTSVPSAGIDSVLPDTQDVDERLEHTTRTQLEQTEVKNVDGTHTEFTWSSSAQPSQPEGGTQKAEKDDGARDNLIGETVDQTNFLQVNERSMATNIATGEDIGETNDKPNFLQLKEHSKARSIAAGQGPGSAAASSQQYSFSELMQRTRKTYKISEFMKATESHPERDVQRRQYRVRREGSSAVEGANHHREPSLRRSCSVPQNKGFVTHDPGLHHKSSLRGYKKSYLEKYPMEFGGRCGTLLLIVLLPLYTLSVAICKLVPDPEKVRQLYEERLLLIVLLSGIIMAFLLLQAVFSIVPVGTVISGPLTKLGILKMRCNGTFAAILTLFLLSSLCCYKREAVYFVYDMYAEMTVSALLLGILFSLLLYIKGGRAPVSHLNPYGSTGFRWYDFWMGREITPVIQRCSVKVVLHRFSVISTICLNILIVLKALLQGAENVILKTLLTSAVLQSLYCSHFLFREHLYLYSFLATSEGVGYMITVGFMTFPFILTFITKAILDYSLQISLPKMCVMLCVYSIGYILLNSDTRRKNVSIREGGSDDKILDTGIPLWGVKLLPEWLSNVRYRTYAGEIMIHWALAMAAGSTHTVLYVIPSVFTFCVLSRALREHSRSAALRVLQQSDNSELK